MFSLLNRWDVAILVCQILDGLGDSLVFGNLPVFFTEVFGVSDTAVAWAIAFFDLACRLYSWSIAARTQDTWPHRGPFGAVTLTKLLGVVALVGVVLPASWFGFGTTYGFFSTSLAYNTVLALTETLSSAVYANAYTRVARGRDERVQPLLWSVSYWAGNVALVLSRLTMFGTRSLPISGAVADILIIAVGVAFFGAAAAMANVLRVHFHDDKRMQPSPAAESDATWAESVPYFLYAAVLVGSEVGSDQLGLSLPKFVMRRYGDRAQYPLYQMINPLLVLLLLPVVTYVLPLTWSIPWLLVAGTSIQALSWLWIALFGNMSRYVVVGALAQYTIGELVGFSRLTAWMMATVVPDGNLGLMQSRLTIPRGLLSAGVTAGSGYMLEAFCPSAAHCDARFWWLVAGVTALTPLTMPLFLVYMNKRRPV